jgi:hypothetical protein
MSSFIQVNVLNEHQWRFLVWGKGVIRNLDDADLLPVTPALYCYAQSNYKKIVDECDIRDLFFINNFSAFKYAFDKRKPLLAVFRHFFGRINMHIYGNQQPG